MWRHTSSALWPAEAHVYGNVAVDLREGGGGGGAEEGGLANLHWSFYDMMSAAAIFYAMFRVLREILSGIGSVAGAVQRDTII